MNSLYIKVGGGYKILNILANSLEYDFPNNREALFTYIDPLVLENKIPIPFSNSHIKSAVLQAYNKTDEIYVSDLQNVTTIDYNEIIKISDTEEGKQSDSFYELRFFNKLQTITHSGYSHKFKYFAFPNNLSTINVFSWSDEAPIFYNLPSNLTSLVQPLQTTYGGTLYGNLPDGLTSLPEACFGVYNPTYTIPFTFASPLTILPSNLVSLGGNCFAECKNIEIEKLPETLETIGKDCFRATNIKISKIPSKITTYPVRGFQDCPNLNITEIPETVTSIGYQCFTGTTTFPNGIYIKNTTPPSYSDSFNSEVIIYVPNDSVSVYQGATGWKKHTIKPISERP